MIDGRRDLPRRLQALQYVISALFGVLAVSFWYLQVAQHARFREMAENNHQRTLALRAPRGPLFHREGRILVQNRPAFNISLVREQTKDLDRTMATLRLATGVPEGVFRDVVARVANKKDADRQARKHQKYDVCSMVFSCNLDKPLLSPFG